MTNLDVARGFMDAVGAGDEQLARSFVHPDCGIWHNYDNATQTIDENMFLMQRMIAASKERVYEIHALEEVTGGYMQRHTLHITTLDDEKCSAEALIWAKVKDGKIAYVEEFIDPSSLAPLIAKMAPPA